MGVAQVRCPDHVPGFDHGFPTSVPTRQLVDAGRIESHGSSRSAGGQGATVDRVTPDSAHTVLITPLQFLAVSVDGALQEIFPRSTDGPIDGETGTAREALALLGERIIATGEPDHSPGTPPSQRTASADAPLELLRGRRAKPGWCPARGVVTCPDCDWTTIATGAGRYHSVGHHASPVQPPDAN